MLAKSLLVFLVLMVTLYKIKADAFLPTVVWDKANPLFQCSDPTFRLREGDLIQIHCMEKLLHNYLRASRTLTPDKLRMVHVKDEHHYNTCNTAGSQQLLTCEQGQESQICGKGGKDCTKFYDLLYKSIQDPNFFGLKRGEMNYFIGLSFEPHIKDNRAPCFGNDTEFNHPMKFRVYVCTKEEEDASLCEPCTTEACFYSRCQEQCGLWKDSNSSKIVYDKQDICYKQQTQECRDKLTNAVRSNTRDMKIPCPSPKCANWRNSELINYQEGVCSKQRSRVCVNFRGANFTEKKQDIIQCPKRECPSSWTLVEKKTTYIQDTVKCFEKYHKYCKFEQNGKMPQLFQETEERSVKCQRSPEVTTTPLVAAARFTNEDDDDNKDLYIKIAIGASIAAFAFGMIVGAFLFKLLQNHTKPVEVVKTVEKFVPVEGLGPAMAYDNKHFHLDPVLEDGEPQTFSIADVEFVPTTQQVGSTTRKVMVARSISFYNPDQPGGQYQNQDRRNSEGTKYQPPSTMKESNRNVMRHPSATSKTVLIRHHSDVTERARSDSDTSVFHLKQPEDSVSEEV